MKMPFSATTYQVSLAGGLNAASLITIGKRGVPSMSVLPLQERDHLLDRLDRAPRRHPVEHRGHGIAERLRRFAPRHVEDEVGIGGGRGRPRVGTREARIDRSGAPPAVALVDLRAAREGGMPEVLGDGAHAL